ncbi:ribosome-binding factor A [Nannocystis sp. SCPEA4]|uniref:ribosome-binding factor A n=1 Tax=Nannocystis sp. SCPEA4 TaxID=2996787 RepID=UPI002271942D|nr:ribosome-binding factor A [Nannocystis sp. SCPEA4]
MNRHRDRRRRRASATTEYSQSAPSIPGTVDPAVLFGAALPSQARRKLDQLSRQVEERLALVLTGEVDDPHVSALTLLGVEPEPGSGNLVVVLALPIGAGGEEAELALRRLDALRPYLRSEIAGAIHRKRTPNLVFRVVPAPRGPGGANDNDEEVEP